MPEPLTLQGPPEIVDLVRPDGSRQRAWAYHATRDDGVTLRVFVLGFDMVQPEGTTVVAAASDATAVGRDGMPWTVEAPEEDG